MRPKYCQYCDLNIPCKDFAKHFKECESRTEPCEKCGQSVVNKEYAFHVATCTGKKVPLDSGLPKKKNGVEKYEMEDSLSRFSKEISR